MNPAHLHLMLIHFPIATAFLALPLLGYAILRRGDRGATGAAALVLAIGAGSAYFATETGEDAEEIVEELPGVSEAAISEHEERAETAMVLSIVTGLVGLGAAGLAFTGRTRPAQWVLGAALLADAATSGAMAWTANAGGAIRHPEIVDGAGGVAGDGSEARSEGVGREEGGEGERDDD
jgi:uncharacterized membrane protein